VSRSALGPSTQKRCLIYTRKSSEEGLEQNFNSLHAQREACEAFIKSQSGEGWILSRMHYDDGGCSGGNTDRPALGRLLDEIKQGNADIVVVYKVDRLSRSLADFVRLIDLFDKHDVSFVSVTQQFNTSSSMGRLTLNVLLSFAQFEREVTSERIRDKIAASKKKGLWMGGRVSLGYDANDKRLCVNDSEAETVQHIYHRYLALGCVRKLKAELDNAAYVSKTCSDVPPNRVGKRFSRGALYTILKNPLYVGKIRHRDQLHDGQHDPIVEHSMWEAVQRRFERSGDKKMLRTAAKNPSLLAGLIFDDKGNPMSATHSTKSNRRCRYYISQAVLQFREADAGSVQRIAAESLEATIIGKLMDLLRSGNELLAAVGPCKVSGLRKQQLVSQAKTLAGQWDRLTPHEQITHLKQFVRRVIVGRTELRVSLSRQALVALLLEDPPFTDDEARAANDAYGITIPVNLKRCGIEMKLIVPNGVQPKAHPITIGALQEAVRKALLWNQALVTGQAASLRELATQEQVTPSYIGTLIKLAFLAPDIIEAIVRREVPVELSLDRLKKGFPLDWEAQRKTLGFSG
jgi:DNA invertase Pin-like site-specific DNA recombinase